MKWWRIAQVKVTEWWDLMDILCSKGIQRHSYFSVLDRRILVVVNALGKLTVTMVMRNLRMTLFVISEVEENPAFTLVTRSKRLGKSVSGQDAVEVILESRASKARIVFAKGVGLVATVFQESSMPAGTAEVFIGGRGSGFLGE
jgi:hypothetical protein